MPSCRSRASGQLHESILRVKGMKKYSHLFLFVLLLNATTNAQNLQIGAPTASAKESLTKTAATALQSFGRAAAAISPMVEIAPPVIPASSPTSSVKTEAASLTKALTEAAQKTVSAGATAIAKTPISGRGVRKTAGKTLKGQTTGDAKIDSMIITAATRHGVEPLLLYSVMCQESVFKSQAVSPKGARGLMQLMPATAARFGVKNIFDPEQNIHGAAQYLRFLLDLFDGDVSLALAGYNAGEGAVKKYGYAVPPYPETINYVRKIKRRYTNLSTLSE